jgi:hypothetical protein
MISDYESNIVYVADTLERRFPAIYEGLKTILELHKIPFSHFRDMDEGLLAVHCN